MGLLLAYYLLTLFVTQCKTNDVDGPEIAYCDVKQRRNNLTGTDEFGFYANMEPDATQGVGSSTQLICCAQGYDALEWIKDGTYVFIRGGPTSSLYASRHGGRIFIIKNTTASDQGYYTCKITRGNETRQHKLYLFVGAKSPYPPPKVEERPDNTSAPVGGKAEFLCEGRFARDQPLAEKYVDWFRIRQNGIPRKVTNDTARHAVITNYREQRLYKNAKVIIDPVIEEDFYSTYQCRIYNYHSVKHFINVSLTEAPAPVGIHGPYPVIGTVLMVILVTMVITSLLCRHFQLEIKLIWWDTFGKNEITGNVGAGAFLVYNGDNETDHEFATVTLLDRLEIDLGYPILVQDRDFMPGSAIGEEYIRCMSSSARFVAILSPAFFDDPWCMFALNSALENHHKMVFVVHQEIENWDEIDIRDTMRSAMSVIKTIDWPGEDDSKNVERFYKKLRLRLPPRLTSSNSEQQQQKVSTLVEHEKTVSTVEQHQHKVSEVKRKEQDFTRF